MTTTTTTPATTPPVPAKRNSPGCGGDGCTSRDPWPLHHLRHRGLLRRLCTSCVLRYHRGSFCSACFDLLPSPPPPTACCSKCPAAVHLSCLPDSYSADGYLCRSCSAPNPSPYFPADDPPDGRRRSIDLTSAKVLLAAAQLAAKSMTRASTVARAEAERKVSEATLARKRAREMLDRALAVSVMERKKAETFAATEVKVLKKKVTKKGGSVPALAALLVQDNNSEKGYQFHESDQNHIMAASKDRLGTLPHIPNHVKQEQSEREINGQLSSSQDFADVKDAERGFAAEPDKCSRMHQGAVVSRTNNGGTLMRVPSTASLHS